MNESDLRRVLEGLAERQAAHPFWQNRLFQACRAGALTLDDLRYVFTQYHHYSRNFTRYLAALMVRCDDDAFRARITENLWDEGGGLDIEQRHSEIFRKFLRGGLGLDPAASLDVADYARYFAREYLDYVLEHPPLEGSAFLSLGTEGVVARMYGVLVDGLLQAGVTEEHLHFFRIHMACDDAHALTLQELMLSYGDERGFADRCLGAMNAALGMRHRFFENVYEAIQTRRVRPLLERIQARKSLAPAAVSGGFRRASSEEGPTLYANAIEKLNIAFRVEKLPFLCEVLDPRVVRIEPGKHNEHHRHAHETIFFIVQGTGRVLVDDESYEVGPGDVLFAPRWCMHQTQNAGVEEMVLLAVTDFGLTGKGFLGDYDKTARLKHKAPAINAAECRPLVGS
ncbi:hypothetical protein BH11MYX4_BH11MYX4_01660 [soil metagenome]